VRRVYLLCMNLVAEPFEKPRVHVRRFRACHRKRALWKKSRVDRRVGGDPVNGVDRDGRWFGIDDALAIGIGAIAGGVTACMNGHCSVTDGKFWAYVGGGALIGEAALLTGGVAAGAMGATTATAGGAGVAGGFVGGAVAGAGNYTLGSGVETGFKSFSGNGFMQSTLNGAIAGGVGGGEGSAIGSGVWGAMGGGFAGGATGSYLNGARGMDVLYGGLIGAGVSAGAFSAKWGYNEYLRPGDLDNVTFSDESSTDVPEKPIGSVNADEWEELAIDDFKEYHSEIPDDMEFNGESRVVYRRSTNFWTGDPTVDILKADHFPEARAGAPLGGDMVFHSHPYHPYFSSGDYIAGSTVYADNGGYCYLLAPNNSSVFRMLPSTSKNFLQVRY